MAKRYIDFVILFFLIFFVSCSSVQEARQTLNEADSLLVEGVLYNDSMSISRAVKSLNTFRYFYPSDYAKANYYYGRLLRKNGDQTAAMQCFIDASHTDPETPYFKRIGYKYRRISVNELNLLGRVYSNIGSLCHLADNFTLSYQIYKISASKFNKANNLTAYYYSLNNMAFEMAEQNNHDATISLLNKISIECHDANVCASSYLTKAVLYLNIGQPDSAIYYSDKGLDIYSNEPFGYVIKAQAYWDKQDYDSALFIAKKVVSMPNISPNEKVNMLYILAYNDSSINKNQIKQLAEERTDIEIEIISPYKKQLAQAIHILNKDINRKPNRTGFVIIFCVIISIFGIIVYSIIKIKIWRQQQYKETQQKIDLLTRTAKQEQQNLLNSNMHLQYMQDTYRKSALRKIEENCTTIRQSNDIKQVLSWKDYNIMCEIINQNFYLLANKLQQNTNLSEQEIRLCVLILLELNHKQIADMLNYSISGVGKFKYRVAQKLDTSSMNLRDCLLEIAIGK